MAQKTNKTKSSIGPIPAYTPSTPPKPAKPRKGQWQRYDTAKTTQAALSILFGYHRANGRGSAIAADGTDMTAWWHTALADRETALIAALTAAVRENNANVTALASGLDLDVKQVLCDSISRQTQYGIMTIPDRVLQYDAAAMARRIEAAAANHKNRAKNRSTSQNRNLKYVCPTCERPIRSAGGDRIILCGGTYHAPHEPMPCQIEEMPENRADDIKARNAATAEDLEGAFLSKTGDQSAAQTSAHNARMQAKLAAKGAKQALDAIAAGGFEAIEITPSKPHSDIPF